MEESDVVDEVDDRRDEAECRRLCSAKACTLLWVRGRIAVAIWLVVLDNGLQLSTILSFDWLAPLAASFLHKDGL